MRATTQLHGLGMLKPHYSPHTVYLLLGGETKVQRPVSNGLGFEGWPGIPAFF